MQMAILLRVQDFSQCEQALALLNKVIESDPNYPLAYAQMAICQYHLGKYDDAISSATREIDNDPSQIWVHQIECLCYERKGEDEKAEHADELALESPPNSQTLTDRARNYSSLLAYQHAERDFRKEMAASPDDYYPVNGLAWLLAEEMKERLDEAEQLAAQALELVRKSESTPEMKVDVTQLMDTHAWILFRLGRRDEARRELEQGLALYDENLEMHDHLAAIKSAVLAE
jgi:tetratricopeptide (TPR) repeat protein